MLGYDKTVEKQLLPTPASAKINGACVSHQKIPLGSDWLAMSWDPHRWQRLVTFKPETDRMPPSSLLSVQVMFDESRVDWAATRLPSTNLPFCRMSLVSESECASTTNSGVGFSIMDASYSGIPHGKIPVALYTESSGGFLNCPPKDGFARWRETPDSCKMDKSTPKPDSLKFKPPTLINSQYCPVCSTRIVDSRMSEYQTGENITVIVSSGPADLMQLRCCYRDWGKKGKYEDKSCETPYIRCGLTGGLTARDGRTVYDAGRCAFRGVLHISYWYKPAATEPCMLPTKSKKGM